MGRQINFYITEGEAQSFEQEAIDLFELAVISRRANTRQAQLLVPPFSAPVQTYFVRRQDLPNVVMEKLATADEYLVNLDASPVVEYLRFVWSGGSSFPGCRLWYQPRYFRDDGVVLTKPAQFIEFADELFRYVRRRCPRQKELAAYVSPSVMKLLRSDQILLLK